MNATGLSALDGLPDSALVPVSWVREILDLTDLEDAAPTVEPAEPVSWRERLWTVGGETRIGVAELAEALDRPRSYVYARTGPKAENPIPHRKLDAVCVFVVAEVRQWYRDREEIVIAGRMDSPARRRLVSS